MPKYKVFISNPGTLPVELTKAANKAPNPLINNISREANIGTNLGTNIGTNIGTDNPNVGTDSPNVATDHLAENKRIVDKIVKKKVKPRMTKEQLRECIIEACIVDHSIDELATLLKKNSDYLQNSIIPELVADGILLPTKPRHSPGQTYMTNPKYSKA